VGVFRTESPDTHCRELVKRDYVCVCACVRARVALIVFLNGTFGAGDSLGVHGDSPAFPTSHIFILFTLVNLSYFAMCSIHLAERCTCRGVSIPKPWDTLLSFVKNTLTGRLYILNILRKLSVMST